MNKIYIRGNEIATKEYVDSLSFEGGNADLSNYYTKEETDNLLSQDSEIVINTGVSLSFGYQSNSSFQIGTIVSAQRTEIANIVNSYYAGDGKFTKPIVFNFNGVKLKPMTSIQENISEGRTVIHFVSELTTSTYRDPYKYDLATIKFSFCFEGSQGSFTPYYNLNLSHWKVSAYFINYLSKNNAYAYTPTSDYHPATKKYVDDAIMNVGGGGDDYIPTFVLNTGSTTDIFVSNIDIRGSVHLETLQAFSEFLTKCYAEGRDIINIALKTSNNNTLLFNMMTSSFQKKPTYLSTNALYFQNRALSPDSNNPLTIIQGILRMVWDDNNVVTVNSFETLVQRNYLLTTKNTDAYTPTGDYNPATKKYVDDAISTSIAGISATSMEIATSLPTANISTSTIYLVKDETASTDTGNVYNEYIYINGAWENIGSTKTTVDLSKYSTTEELSQMLSTALSNYLTTADMNAALSSYYTKTATDEAIENAINNIEHPTTDLSNYYNKQEIDTMIGDINSILDTINGEEV